MLNLSEETKKLFEITEEETGVVCNLDSLSFDKAAASFVWLLLEATQSAWKTSDPIPIEKLRAVTAVAGLVLAGAIPAVGAIDYVNMFFGIKSRSPQKSIKQSLDELLNQKELLVSQVAKLFDVDSRTVQHWIKNEGLNQKQPHAKIKVSDCLSFARKQVKKYHNSKVRNKFQGVLDKHDFHSGLGPSVPIREAILENRSPQGVNKKTRRKVR